jgi:hypothetical protein
MSTLAGSLLQRLATMHSAGWRRSRGSETWSNGSQSVLNGGESMSNGSQSVLNGGESMSNGAAPQTTVQRRVMQTAPPPGEFKSPPVQKTKKVSAAAGLLLQRFPTTMRSSSTGVGMRSLSLERGMRSMGGRG